MLVGLSASLYTSEKIEKTFERDGAINADTKHLPSKPCLSSQHGTRHFQDTIYRDT